MLKVASVRVRSSGIRWVASTSFRLNGKNVGGKPFLPDVKKGEALVTPPSIEPIPIQEVKAKKVVEGFPEYSEVKGKRFSLFGFLFKTSLLAVVFYGGVLYIATKNDKVMDYVIDHDLPYHEQIIESFDNVSKEDIREAWFNLKQQFFKVKTSFSNSEFDHIATAMERKGEEFLKDTRNKLKKHPSGERKGTELTPAEQLQKPVEVESVTRDVTRFPLIELSSDVADSVDSSVKQIITSLNSFIQSIDAGLLPSSNSDLVKSIGASLNQLGAKMNTLTSTFDNELKNKLKESQTELASSFSKKELELTDNLLARYNQEKAQLEKKLNEKLEREVKAAREAINQAAINAVSMVRIEQTKKFEKLVTERINEERNGRLANLEKLNDKVKELEKFAASFQDQIVKTHEKTLIQRSASALKAFFFAPIDANAKPKSPKPYIDALAQVSKDDEILNLALKELTPLIAKDSSHSILTTAQLLTRFENLAPDLRSSSLLPPNAGLLGHLSSLIFSKLLMPVKGVKKDGKDIESVIARIESSLVRGELDIAVEEAANLKGWTRRLANDWVVEARKRLEVEFLLNLIDSESRLL
ncbi:MIC60 [Candida oxycetoniae]|uniref:MICOS complex subunit MIC60 n=1 Tax=Candida oxycetoniae TaxID=497107 RepID=A0AAI9WXA0_9ASCO|nr:MIC60 [Candida oxycetoniae]KAI3403789.2 MIC60 [Candida oxycetoniae]